MGEMKIYKIQTKLQGDLTQLPDSQKIFGALIYLYADQYGSETATRLVKDIKDKKMVFEVSNMLPFGYFPLPESYLSSCIQKKSALKNKEEKQHGTSKNKSAKEIYQSMKKRQYVPERSIKYDLVKNPAAIKACCDYISLSTNPQLRTAIDSRVYDLPGLDSTLYSIPRLTVWQMKGNKKNKSVTDFCFYLKFEEDSNVKNLYQTLIDIKKSQFPLFLGPRASQGMNTFTIQNILEEKIEIQSSRYLNLGMLLLKHFESDKPEKQTNLIQEKSAMHLKSLDFSKSYFSLFTSERRPYHIAEGWSTSVKKQFISFIQAGSIIYTDHPKQLGCSIQSPFDPDAIVFGNSFLYPLKEEDFLE